MRCAIAIVSAAAGFLAVGLGTAAGQPVLVNDDFDCYQPGDLVSRLPSWELSWGLDAVISDDVSFSGPNSLHLHREQAHALQWVGPFERERVTYSMMTYVPASSAGLVGAVIPWALDGLPPHLGHIIAFDTSAGVLELLPSATRPPTTPLILDRWVEFRAEIDLAADSAELYYDGVHWTRTEWPRLGDVIAPMPRFEAISFTLGALTSGPGMYIDDVIVTQPGVTPPPTCDPGCYADCDGSGDLDLFDFVCFQNQFATGDPSADCDASGDLDFFDFLCFQNEFAAGCP